MANAVLFVMWCGVTAYALLAGADFGAGFWDLLAGRADEGAERRQLIQKVIGPVWEANHVWLIFVLVILWTAFPPVFASMTSTLYLPLTAAAIGIILRGAAFAFRGAVHEAELQRVFGAGFASSSVITPFFLGTVAGAVASGRVPLGNARGDTVASWINPTSLIGGLLAVLACAFLAAVYLCHDAESRGAPDIAEWFRFRALITGAVVTVVAAAGVAVLRADSRYLFHGLTHRAAPLVAAAAIFGAVTVILVARRRFVLARPAAGIAVGAIVWAWAVGQYPMLLVPSVRVHAVAAPGPVLSAVLVAHAVGMVMILPALVWLLVVAQRPTSVASASHRRDG
jgi:cytochrome d ubiquinol oxidase subunit II